MEKFIEGIDEIKQLDVHPFSSSNREQYYIVTYNNKNYEVSESVAELILLLKNTETMEEVVEEISLKKKRDFSVNEVEQLIGRFISPILNASSSKNSYIWMRKELISAKKIAPVTTFLGYFFRPRVAVFLIGVIAVLQGLFFYTTGSTTGENFTPGLFSFFMYGSLFFFSIIFHELGHASACRYYKVDHGRIGFGVYLYFPVFYADVSSIWRLKRSQRVVVDLAGIYFQLIFLIPLIVLYLNNGQDELKYLIYAINISFLFDLNPFFRFDGYWLFTDLLGVSNLRRRTNQALVYLGKKIAGQKNLEKPYLFKVKSKERYGFWVYVVASNLFFVYYILYRLPLFMFDLFRDIPGQVHTLMEGYKTGHSFEFELFGIILVQLLIGLLIFYMIYKISNNLVKFLMRKSVS